MSQGLLELFFQALPLLIHIHQPGKRQRHRFDRLDFIETKEVLMARSQVLAARGRGALMEDLLAGYREADKLAWAAKTAS